MTCMMFHVSLKEKYISIIKLQRLEEKNCHSHGQRKPRIFGVCWPCKTCMVISVKSTKILTCIELHHTVNLNGGLDGCSSILKVQYSRSTPKNTGKKIVSENDRWIFFPPRTNSQWKTQWPLMPLNSCFQMLKSLSLTYSNPRSFSWLSFCHLRSNVL